MSNVFDGTSIHAYDVSALSLLQDPKIVAGDIVIMSVTVLRVPTPNIAGCPSGTLWMSWEVGLCLHAIVLLTPLSRGPAMSIGVPGIRV